MSASDATAATEPAQVRFYDVVSADGTRLRAWTNDADGPTVLLCNGLGTNAHAWPALLRPDCGIRVVSWHHRGTSGSDRPASGRVDMDSMIEDALAVMDDAGLASAPVAGWSIGVTAAFVLAERHPERVQGLFAVAGVPGNTYGTMLAPFRIPSLVARHTMITLSRLGYVTNRFVAPLSTKLPWTTWTAKAVQATGFIHPRADTEHVRLLLREFASNEPGWFAHLALNTADHARVSLSAVRVPTVFIAGSWDILTGAGDMRSAAARIDGARFVELPGSHFLMIEYPDLIHAELLAFVARVA